MKRTFLTLLALHLLTSFTAGAAQKLVVNGVNIAEFTNTLVPGTSYVAADPFARAIGATYLYSSDAQIVSFELAGRFATVEVGSGEGEARFQGQGVYVPVKEVARRLGGEVDYLTEARTVVVVFPRARLRSVQPPDAWGSYERFVLRFSAPVAVEERFEPSLNAVRFRFGRTDLVQKQSFSGERFSDAALLPGEGYTDFMLTLGSESTYEMYTVPEGLGTEVVIDIFSLEDAPAEEESEAPQAVVLDSSRDAALTAGVLRDALAQRGIEVVFDGGGTPALERRMAAGVGAPLFLSLQEAPLEAGQFNLYYLAEGGTGLGAVIRQSAAEVRAADVNEPNAAQRVLQRLAPDLSQGEAYARTLSDALIREGWQAVRVEGMPLYLLSGAAGRGLMLELSPADLTSDTLPDTLADALAALLP